MKPNTTEPTFTPGPWKYHPDISLIETELPNLCDEYQHICDFRQPVNEADARLIEAAPDLLEALERLLAAAIHCDPLFESRWEHDSRMARDAIAKATKASGK